MLPLLQVTNLTTTFRTSRGLLTAVNDVSFQINSAEIVGLVGESGSGKSVTSRSMMGLIPQPPGKVTGSILLEDKELLYLSNSQWQKIRGEHIAMIFQDPMTSLNPLYTVGEQVAEVLRFHKKMKNSQAIELTKELFYQVGIPNPTENINAYPHQLSGGMRQRAMIAMAIACSPRLLIADEPTTALDVTIQAQILDLLLSLNEERKMAILLITHDLGVIAETCKRVIVMYAGRIMEKAQVDVLFEQPRHPYTLGLMKSRPIIEQRQEKLQQIPGSPPNLIDIPSGCPFHPRCLYMKDICQQEVPALREMGANHFSACHFAEELG